MNKDKKKILGNVLKYSIFVILIIVTFSIVFKQNDFGTFIDNLKHANPLYITLGICCMFVFLLAEALNVRLILKNLGDKLTLRQVFRYSLIGFFFSSITPSSTGGQPAQIYFMNKDDIPVPHSTLALLVELMGYQFALGLLAFIGFFLNFNIIVHKLGNLRYLVFLGIGINLVIVSALMVVIFSKKLALKIVSGITKLLRFFKYSKVDKFEQAFQDQIEEYHRCSIYLKENKSILVRVLFTNIIQLTAYHAVPYFVYLSFGLSGSGAITIVSMEAVLYVAVASLPFPGAVGVSEGSFMIMFKMFFGELLGSAMIISRGINFYLFVLISGLGVAWSFILAKRKRKYEENLRKE